MPLAGLKDPPEMGPANKMIPVTTIPITIPARFACSFFEVTPRIVRIKKKVNINS